MFMFAHPKWLDNLGLNPTLIILLHILSSLGIEAKQIISSLLELLVTTIALRLEIYKLINHTIYQQ